MAIAAAGVLAIVGVFVVRSGPILTPRPAAVGAIPDQSVPRSAGASAAAAPADTAAPAHSQAAPETRVGSQPKELQSAQASASGANRPLANQLAFDRMLLDGKGLRLDQADRLMGTDDFTKLQAAMSRTMDADGLVLTRAYRNSIEASLAKSGKFSIDSLECGPNYCAASFRGASDDQSALADAFQNRPKQDPRAYATVGWVSDQPDSSGFYQFRSIFTINPALASITVPPPQPGAR
jgi:hypothetical protein